MTMKTMKLLGGTAHKQVPPDLEQAILKRPAALKLWGNITPLARNEWICLVLDAKKPETRQRRIVRTYDQLSKGQRRPCCWQGCPHRQKIKI